MSVKSVENFFSFTQASQEERKGSTDFMVSFEQLQDCPIGVLQALHEQMKESHSFPKICYENSYAVDCGGLSRDLMTRLFNEIFDKKNPRLPVYKLGSYFFPLIDPDFNCREGGDASYSSQLFYQAIGSLFAAAIKKDPHPIVTGNHFHPVLFEMLYSLSLEDVTFLPQRFTTLEDLLEHKDMLKKILPFYLNFKTDGLAEQKKELVSQLAGAFIENQFPDALGVCDSKEDFLNAYPNADKLILGALAIAQGMYLFEGKWDLNSHSPRDLQLNIEGYFGKEEVSEAQTCSHEMEIPRNYPDYETFKRMLEANIHAAANGFQAI